MSPEEFKEKWPEYLYTIFANASLVRMTPKNLGDHDRMLEIWDYHVLHNMIDAFKSRLFISLRWLLIDLIVAAERRGYPPPAAKLEHVYFLLSTQSDETELIEIEKFKAFYESNGRAKEATQLLATVVVSAMRHWVPDAEDSQACLRLMSIVKPDGAEFTLKDLLLWVIDTDNHTIKKTVMLVIEHEARQAEQL